MEKPFLTYEEQLSLLEKRGIKIKDRERALLKIKNINYYKIKEFAEPFKKVEIIEENGIQIKKETYECISFEGIITRFYTDKNLRIYLLDAIEKVELSIKTKLGYLLGKYYGENGYLEFKNWCNKDKYCQYYIRDQEKQFIRRINEYILERDNAFIKEILKDSNSSKKIPIWLIMEILTFGDIVKIYELMSNKLRKELSAEYDLEANTLEKYLKNLKLVRNFSAHNKKIIDLKLITCPPLRKEWEDYLEPNIKGLAITIFILKQLINKINPKYGFGNIHKTLSKYISHKNIKANYLGFKNYESINYLFKK